MRLFILSGQLRGGSLFLESSAYHHVLKVVRIKSGDRLELVVNDTNCLIGATVKEVASDHLVLSDLQTQSLPKRTLHIALAQALPKQDKMADILEKCTEIGVSAFIPLSTSRCISKPPEKKEDRKAQRWEKIIASAAEQSRQPGLPDLMRLMTLSELVSSTTASYDLKLIFWEDSQVPLKVVLKQHPEAKRILMVIGPEGGLDSREVTQLRAAGFLDVSMGESILRVQHAGFMAVSQVLYAYGEG